MDSERTASAESIDPGAFFDPRFLLDLNALVGEQDPDGPPTLRVVQEPTGPAATSAPGRPRRVGVLAGSFNPPHRAHGALVERSLATGMDAVYYALSARIVDKERPSGLGLADRLLLLVLDARSRVGAGVLFLNRGLYVDQAEIVRATWPDLERLDFVVGFDKIVQIFDPRYYDDRDAALRRLFALAGFVVAPRFGRDTADLAALLDRAENRPFADRVRLLPLPADLADLSSTWVREVVGNGAEPGEVSRLVREFITTTGAFAPPVRLPSGELVDRYALRMALLEALGRHRAWAIEHADVRRLLSLMAESSASGRELRSLLADPSADPMPALEQVLKDPVAGLE